MPQAGKIRIPSGHDSTEDIGFSTDKQSTPRPPRNTKAIAVLHAPRTTGNNLDRRCSGSELAVVHLSKDVRVIRTLEDAHDEKVDSHECRCENDEKGVVHGESLSCVRRLVDNLLRRHDERAMQVRTE
jgi:hypothetical protein